MFLRVQNAYREKRFDEVVKLLNKLIKEDPRTIKTMDFLSFIMFEQKQYHQALACAYTASQLCLNAAHLFNVAMCLRALLRYPDATEKLTEAKKIEPDNADILNKLGLSLLNSHNFNEAMKYFSQVIKLQPNNHRAAYDIATILLTVKEFNLGWPKYRTSLFKLPNTIPKKPVLAPPWDGNPIQGRILISHDQGYGDMIQFIRFAALVRARCDWLAVEVPAVMHELFQTVSGIDEVISTKLEPIKGFDKQVYLSLLPGLFNYNPISSPQIKTPYIGVSKDRVATVEKWLPNGAQSRLRIGIVWRGGGVFELDHLRSIPLSIFMPLLEISSIDIISLQFESASQDLDASGVSGLIYDAGPHIKTFSDTTAIISKLDLLICCDTSVAHLAGALNKPVWILLRYLPDWRWLTERTDSPWYPTVRLFRQQRPGDWVGVGKKVVRAVHQMLARSQKHS